MHKETVTCVAVAAATDFLLTGSADGYLKFWKKRPGGVEFVKHFRAHKGAVDGKARQPLLVQSWTLIALLDSIMRRHQVQGGVSDSPGIWMTYIRIVGWCCGCGVLAEHVLLKAAAR